MRFKLRLKRHLADWGFSDVPDLYSGPWGHAQNCGTPMEDPRKCPAMIKTTSPSIVLVISDQPPSIAQGRQRCVSANGSGSQQFWR